MSSYLLFSLHTTGPTECITVICTNTYQADCRIQNATKYPSLLENCHLIIKNDALLIPPSCSSSEISKSIAYRSLESYIKIDEFHIKINPRKIELTITFICYYPVRFDDLLDLAILCTTVRIGGKHPLSRDEQ